MKLLKWITFPIYIVPLFLFTVVACSWIVCSMYRDGVVFDENGDPLTV